MRSMLRLSAVLVLAWALPAHARQPPVYPNLPMPEDWKPYWQAVRAADGIADPEARCLAYPDLPGNRWPKGAAKARCSLLRAPLMSLDQVERTLSKDGGAAELERRYGELLDAHYRKPAQREEIFRAFGVFAGSQRGLRIAQRWAEQAPDSVYARMALAEFHWSAGQDARGEYAASDTSQAQFDKMQRSFDLAIPLYRQALELEPRLSVACVRLASIGRLSDHALQREALAQCLKIDPDSYYVVWEGIVGAQPRWGGSQAQLDKAAAYAAERARRNPLLGALVGEAAADELDNVDPVEQTLDRMFEVAAMAPSGTFMGKTGHACASRGKTWLAAGYYSQATRFWPANGDFRQRRAQLFGSLLNELDWALRDMRIAIQDDPDDGFRQLTMAGLVNSAEGPIAARPYLLAAAKEPRLTEIVLPQLCESYIEDPAAARDGLRCSRSLVEQRPEDADSWRIHASILYHARDPQAKAAIDRYLEMAATAPRQAYVIETVKGWRDALDKGQPAP